MLDLRDLLPGQTVADRLAVRERRGLSRYQGGFFYTLVLGNATGEMPAKVWLGPDQGEAHASYDRMVPGAVVHVEATVTEYRGALELSVETPPEPVPAAEVDPAAYLPRIEADARTLGRRLVKAARSIGDEALRAVVVAAWEDPELQERLLEAPAGTAPHLARLGALVERLHGLVLLVEAVAVHQPTLDRDLLVAGVLLWGLGMADALGWNATVETTAAGLLLGPGTLADRRVQALLEEVDVPAPRALRVRHVVLAAHVPTPWRGRFGARTPEALVLRELVRLEAEVARTLAGVQRVRERGEEAGWSGVLRQEVVVE